MLLRELIKEDEAIKQEIIARIDGLDGANDDDLQLLDKLYTILNKSKVVDRIGTVLPDVLKGEYTEKMIMQIAGAIADAPLTFAQKVQFAENLKQNKCINPNVLTSVGIYTIDQLCYNNEINKVVFDHLKSFGVGQQMKGPCEHALAIMSTDVSIKGKGDVDVGGVPVEVKAAIGTKGNGGRFGETGEVPAYNSILDLLHSYSWLKDPLDQQRSKSVNGAINVKNFVNVLNSIPDVPPAERQEMARKLSELFFGPNGKRLEQALGRPGANPEEVNRAYIKSNFDWYKNSNMGGAWEVLCGIIFAYNTVGTIRNADDLDKVTTKGDNIYLLFGKPQEALFQFNPKA